MTSILTNTAAIAALSTLRTIDASMQDTQIRVSSGLRIGSASDNSAYWAIATTMKSDKESMGVVRDALGLAMGKVEAAYTGLTQVKDLLAKIKDKLVTVQEGGVDRTKVNGEITQLKNQISTIAQSSSFSGENWLYSSANLGTKDMVGSFTRDSTGAISLQMISFDASSSVLLDKNSASRGILSKNTGVSVIGGNNTTNNYYLIQSAAAAPSGTLIEAGASTTNVQLEEMTRAVSLMFDSVVNVAGTLGAIKTRIESQGAFVQSLAENLEKGVSKLVDADMNEESTRLKALQTQQQLAIQALSIANSSAQNIMQLFR